MQNSKADEPKERLSYRHEVVDCQLSHVSGDTYDETYDRARLADRTPF